MMEQKIFDSELRILEILWAGGDLPAKDVAAAAAEQVGWSKTTTYTVLKKCVDKGAVKREEPGFICRPLISRQEVQDYETEDLIDKMFDGSKEKFFAAFLDGKKLSNQEVDSLKRMIDDLSQERRLE